VGAEEHFRVWRRSEKRDHFSVNPLAASQYTPDLTPSRGLFKKAVSDPADATVCSLEGQ
jgi:hypothetical protein